MSISILTDVILPSEVIQAGVRGRNLRSNTRTMSGSGYASVNINWARTLRQYEIGITPMGVENWLLIEGIHEITNGGAQGFLMQDPKDQTVTSLSGMLRPFVLGAYVGTSGAGYGNPVYKLHKRYAAISGTQVYDRRITRPKQTITVRRAGSPVTVGSGAGQIAVDYNTGTVTFVASATASPSSYTVGSTTTVNFSSGTFAAGFSAGQRVWLSGVSGTAASLLNLQSHVIDSISGNNLIIAVNTTGLTASGGTASRFPQATDSLTWSGEFYVPVHFANDDIDWEMVIPGPYDARVVAGPNVLLQEVREE